MARKTAVRAPRRPRRAASVRSPSLRASTPVTDGVRARSIGRWRSSAMSAPCVRSPERSSLEGGCVGARLQGERCEGEGRRGGGASTSLRRLHAAARANHHPKASALCSTPPAGGGELYQRDALRPDPFRTASRARRVKVAAPAAPRGGRLEPAEHGATRRSHCPAQTRARALVLASVKATPSGRGWRRDLDPRCARRRSDGVGTKGVPPDDFDSACRRRRTKGYDKGARGGRAA
jgi:hypothetical protein